MKIRNLIEKVSSIVESFYPSKYVKMASSKNWATLLSSTVHIENDYKQISFFCLAYAFSESAASNNVKIAQIIKKAW